MKVNENTVLISEHVVLVPYKPEHVPKYHEWMKSPFLQEMTASEPLTLEEEYEMQESWHKDEEKLTFIITALPLDSTKSLKDIPADHIKENTVMIGDVNLFFNDPDQDPTFGEIEVMIAEPTYRGTGKGKEAIQLMMAYALEVLGLKTFHAKISMKNDASIQLFQSKFGFYKVAESTVFEEVTLEWSIVIPGPSRIDDYGNEIEAYGSKATVDQRNRVLEIQKTLLEVWSQVRNTKYDLTS